MISVGRLGKFEDFYNYLLLVRGVRESSATYYAQKVGVLLRQSPDFTAPSLNSTFVRLKQEGCKNSYINGLLIVARVYYAFLEQKGVKVDKGILSIKKLKKEAVMRGTLSDSEIESFLLLPPKRGGPKATKNYAMWTLFFALLAFTFARPNEIAKLTPDLVDFGRGVIIVTEENSKTHTPRYLPIPPNIYDELQVYVKTCGKYLFPSKQGGNSRFGTPVFSNVQWCYQFHERLNRLGIKRQGLSVYSFRHSGITRMIEESVPFPMVMKLAGHASPSTTLQYTHITTKDIQLAITKHPLIRKATDPLQILSAFKEVIRGFEFEKNGKFKFSMSESNEGLSVQIKLS